MLFSFATTSAVLFTPALPQLASDFKLTSSQAQWAMTLFLIGFAFGHLIYGPLANGWGRKKALYFGLGLSILGTLMSLFAPNFFLFCIGRLIQALGAASGLKIVFTMMGDLYTKDEAVKAISYLVIGFGMAQGVGPTLGGYLTIYFGWKGCFVFILAYTVLLFILSLLLPETAKELDNGALEVSKIFHNYIHEFKNSFTMLHGALMGLSTSFLYVFATVAPFIAINTIGLFPDEYGLFALFIAAGMIAGTLIGNRLVGKVLPRKMILAGLFISALSIVLMGYLFSINLLNGWSLFVPFFAIEVGGVMVWLFASAKGLSESANKSTASAVMQFMNMGITMLYTLIVAGLIPKLPLTLVLSFGSIVLIQLIIWIILRSHHARSPH